MAETLTGKEVVAQSKDTSIMNTDPVVAKAAIVGIVGAVGSILVIGGWVGEDEVKGLKDAAGEIVPAVILIVSIVSGIWGRMSAYSPRTAAKIAVENAKASAGAAPTLVSPP